MLLADLYGYYFLEILLNFFVTWKKCNFNKDLFKAIYFTMLFLVSEKATSKLLLDPDWDSVIQICDAIRQGDVQ